MESTEDWKKVNVLCIVDQNHERSLVLLDHFRNSKGIQLIVEYNIENEDGILIQRKGNYCSKLKKGKLKIKKLLKLTILDEQEYNTIFSTICRQKQSIASLMLRKCVFTKTWKVAATASISENK